MSSTHRRERSASASQNAAGANAAEAPPYNYNDINNSNYGYDPQQQYSYGYPQPNGQFDASQNQHAYDYSQNAYAANYGEYQQHQQYGAPQYGNYPAQAPASQAYDDEQNKHYPGTYHEENVEDGSLQTYEMARLPTIKSISPRSGGYDDMPPWQKFMEKYLCYCCPRKKLHRIICAISVVVILIIMGIILYFYIPRYPQIKVYDIEFADIIGSKSAYSFTFGNAKDLNTMNFKMNLTMDVGTYNPNPYDFSVESIDLVARMAVNTTYVGQPLQTTPLTSFPSLVQLVGAAPVPPSGYVADLNAVIGTSKFGSIVFPSKAQINYTMVFLLNFSPDPKIGLLNDPTVNEIASACGITDRRNRTRPMLIHYDAASVIPALKPLGFVPTLSNDIHINCPFSKGQIDGVIERVQKGENVSQALAEVFENAPPPQKPTIVNTGGNAAPPPGNNDAGNNQPVVQAATTTTTTIVQVTTTATTTASTAAADTSSAAAVITVATSSTATVLSSTGGGIIVTSTLDSTAAVSPSQGGLSSTGSGAASTDGAPVSTMDATATTRSDNPIVSNEPPKSTR